MEFDLRQGEPEEYQLPPEPTPVLYLKCIEYACMIDLILKNITICLNTHPFIGIVSRLKSKRCHHLFEFDYYVMICLKVFSICVMAYGINCCLRENLTDFKKFRFWFFVYCLLEVLALLGITVEALVSSCSMLSTKRKAMIGVVIFFTGGLFMVVYFFAWKHFLDRGLRYLNEQKLNNGNPRREYDSFNEDEAPIVGVAR